MVEGYLADMPAHKWSGKWSIWPTSHTLVIRSVDDLFPTMPTADYIEIIITTMAIVKMETFLLFITDAW